MTSPGTCLFFFLVGAPDASSANERKKAKTAAIVPSNRGHVQGKCVPHQGTRIVQGREKKVIGNVYAILLTCSHITHQNRIQLAIIESISKFAYIVGVPDPAFVDRNSTVVEYTVLRNSTEVLGSSADGDVIDWEAYP